MYEQSHRDYRLVICTIVCPRRAALSAQCDNAITYKAQRDKNARESEAGERGKLLTCRCVSVMLLRSRKIHEGVS